MLHGAGIASHGKLTEGSYVVNPGVYWISRVAWSRTKSVVYTIFNMANHVRLRAVHTAYLNIPNLTSVHWDCILISATGRWYGSLWKAPIIAVISRVPVKHCTKSVECTIFNTAELRTAPLAVHTAYFNIPNPTSVHWNCVHHIWYRALVWLLVESSNDCRHSKINNCCHTIQQSIDR